MNYKKLKTLYKKEMMDVLRDKKTIFTMVVLPILLYPLIFFIMIQVINMISMKQQERTYYIAYENVKDEERQTLNDWILGDEDHLEYKIKEVESQNPAEELKKEEIDAYLTTVEKEGQITYQIHFLSAVNNSNTVSGMLEEEIDSYAKQKSEENIKKEGLDVNYLLYPVKSQYKDASSHESSVGSILGGFIPFLLITSILMGAMYPAIDATTGEKERGTLETLLTLPIGNMELIMSKFLSVATISIVSVLVNVISMSGIVAYMYSMMSSLTESAEEFHLATFVPAILISLVCVIVFALFMSAIVMCVCAFAKSFKEANNYITPLTLTVMFTGYIGFIPNIELDAKTAMIPVANICLLMKSLLVFKYDFALIIMVLLSNLLYAFIAVWVLSKIYNSESVLFGESLSGIKLFERRKNIKKGSLPSIQESLLILILIFLVMVYAGGVISLSNIWLGLIVPQLMIAVLPILACLYIKGNVKEVFALHIPKMKDLLGGLFLLVGMQGISFTLVYVLTSLFEDQSKNLDMQFTKLLEDVPFGIAVLMIALLPAISEELFFRGYMFTAFKNKLNLWQAILIVSLLFGITHMSLIKLLPTTILGIGLAYGMHKANSLCVSSMMHFLNNAFSVFLFYYGSKIAFFNNEVITPIQLFIFIIISVIFIPLGIRILKMNKE